MDGAGQHLPFVSGFRLEWQGMVCGFHCLARMDWTLHRLEHGSRMGAPRHQRNGLFRCHGLVEPRRGVGFRRPRERVLDLAHHPRWWHHMARRGLRRCSSTRTRRSGVRRLQREHCHLGRHRMGVHWGKGFTLFAQHRPRKVLGGLSIAHRARRSHDRCIFRHIFERPTRLGHGRKLGRPQQQSRQPRRNP